MATRFYLSSTATVAGVTPGLAAWTRTSEGVRRAMFPAKDASASTSFSFWAGAAASASTSCLAAQFISAPLAAGIAFVTTDTYKCYVRCQESAANDNINRQPICIKVYSQDGTSLQATLKALGHYGPNTTEWITVANGDPRSKTLGDGDALGADYTTVAGDRLVIEVGGQVSSSAGTSVTGVMVFGADQAGDLTEAETGQADDPWFEISRTVVFLLAADYVASGGAVLGGSAATDAVGGQVGAPGPLPSIGLLLEAGGGASVGDYAAAGGLTAGGAATSSHTVARDWTAAGGLTAGGAATPDKGKDYLPAGGLVATGVATLARTIAWDWAAAGGLTTGGAATTALARAWDWTAAGGAVLGGAATIVRSTAPVYVGSGGLTSDGAAALIKGKDYLPTGGLVSGGAGALEKTKDYLAGGGLTTSGAASLDKGKDWLANGGLITGGAASLERSTAPAYAGAGGLTSGGAAALIKGKDYLPAGGLVSGGAGTTEPNSGPSWIGAGGLTSGGAATVERTIARDWLAAGGLASGGAATNERSAARDWTGAGGLTTSGQAVCGNTHQHDYTGAGGLELGGAAVTDLGLAGEAQAYEWQAAGGLSVGGDADTGGYSAEPERGAWSPYRRSKRKRRLEQPELALAVAWEFVGTGGLQIGGAAQCRGYRVPVPQRRIAPVGAYGLREIAGSAGTTYVRGGIARPVARHWTMRGGPGDFDGSARTRLQSLIAFQFRSRSAGGDLELGGAAVCEKPRRLRLVA